MTVVYNVLVFLHLIGMASLVGAYLVVVREPRIVMGMWHGVLTQLVTGLVMVGLREPDLVPGQEPLDHAKIGVKLLVALAVAVLVWRQRRREEVPANVVHVIGGLSILNVAVAALW